MIKERLFLGIGFIIAGIVAYYISLQQGVSETFGAGGAVVGLFVAGVSYLIFSFETSEYLKHIELRKR